MTERMPAVAEEKGQEEKRRKILVNENNNNIQASNSILNGLEKIFSIALKKSCLSHKENCLFVEVKSPFFITGLQ